MNNSIRTVLILLVGWTLVGCGRDNPVSSIPERKSHFERTIFTEPKYGNTITLISDKECEIKQGRDILLAGYSRQDNKLRVVMQALGTSTVTYYEISPDGLRDSNSGEVFLLLEPLNKWREQARLAKEAEETRERAARQAEEARKLAVKQAILDRFVDNGDGTLTDAKTGLMWTKNEIGRGSWTELSKKAKGLSIGGYSDWRLPTRAELQTIVQNAELIHTDDHTFFSGDNVTGGRATILSSESENADYAWGFSLMYRQMKDYGKWFQDATALAVREPRKP